MKIIEPSFEIFKLEEDRAPLKKIELCGRTCYQSTHKIGDDTYKKFIEMIMKNGHYSVLEHSNIIISMDENTYDDIMFSVDKDDLKFFKITNDERRVISGNFRAWIELIEKYAAEFHVISKLSTWLNVYYPECFKILVDIKPEDYYNFDLLDTYNLSEIEFLSHVRITVKFIVDRGFLAEIRTHRDASFSAESTRYCCYSKDQFGNELTMILPQFFTYDDERFTIWKNTCEHIECQYMKLIEMGASPQEARTILPNSLKSEIIMTANIEEWIHVFDLRTKEGAHPQMRQIMIPLKEKFKELSYI